MDSVTQFCVGALFLGMSGFGALAGYLAYLLAQANSKLAATSESAILATRAQDPRALAEALNARDAARHDNQMLQKELKNSLPLARNLQTGPESDTLADETMYIGGLALDPLKR